MRNPLSIEAFADWCEKQPVDGEYDYGSYELCACAQYATFLGVKWVDEEDMWLSDWWDRMDSVACDNPRTFGALASRLRASLKEQEQG